MNEQEDDEEGKVGEQTGESVRNAVQPPHGLSRRRHRRPGVRAEQQQEAVRQTDRQTDTPAAKSLETLGKVAQKRATILELKYG